MTSLMVVGYIKFIWMAFLTWVGFLLYNLFSMNINLGWAFSGIAFLAALAVTALDVAAEVFRQDVGVQDDVAHLDEITKRLVAGHAG